MQKANGVRPSDARLTAIEAPLGGRLGVAALDTRTGEHFDHRASERFPMCSTFKFLLVAAILSRVDANKEKLDRLIHYTTADLLDYAPITKAHVQEGAMTIAALCAAAVEYGDNTAANLLLGAAGGPAAVTRYVRSLGDPVTRLDRYEPSANTCIAGDPRDTTSPSAMLHDMQTLLLDKRSLSEDSRRQLEAWLVANTTGAARLRAGVPSSWRIGDRTGSGDNGSTNDIAICWPPSRSPILVTAYFTGSNASDADRSAALAQVGRIVAAAFS
ncbi:MAG: class A beta-lactamase [Candidatus Acidiferrales bacterium]